MPVESLQSAIATHFSIGTARQNCVSLKKRFDSYSSAARNADRLAFYQSKVSVSDTPTLRAFCECSSQKMLSLSWNQKLSSQTCFDVINSQKYLSEYIYLRISFYLNFIIYLFTACIIRRLRLISVTLMLSILEEKNIFCSSFTCPPIEM